MNPDTDDKRVDYIREDLQDLSKEVRAVHSKVDEYNNAMTELCRHHRNHMNEKIDALDEKYNRVEKKLIPVLFVSGAVGVVLGWFGHSFVETIIRTLF